MEELLIARARGDEPPLRRAARELPHRRVREPGHERLVPAMQLRERLLDERHPHLVRRRRASVEQLAVRVAREPVVDRHRPPRAVVVEDERAPASRRRRIVPAAKEAREKPRLQCDHGERGEEPAVAKTALHNVRRAGRVDKERRCRPPCLGAHLRGPQPAHRLWRRLARRRAGGIEVERPGAAEVLVDEGVGAVAQREEGKVGRGAGCSRRWWWWWLIENRILKHKPLSQQTGTN